MFATRTLSLPVRPARLPMHSHAARFRPTSPCIPHTFSIMPPGVELLLDNSLEAV